MKGKMLTDRIRRQLVADAEIPRIALRYVTHETSFPYKTRMLAQFKLAEMRAHTSQHRLVRRCILTGRARSVLDEFNVSRIKFREMALKGQLLAVQKSSW